MIGDQMLENETDDIYGNSFENSQVEDENEHVAYVEEVKVITRGVDFSVRELKSLREEEELIIPEFQRELVWDPKRKSRFIESILLGYPIPNMFFTDYESGQMMIIDGQQRIDTLVEFLSNELRISNREDINPRWRNKFFREIDIDSQKKLRSSNIRAAVFQILTENESDKNTALYSLFERINTGSIQLNAQEIRRAIFSSPFTAKLNEFVNNAYWVSGYRLINLEESLEVRKDKRLKDQEIISRYFTLKELYLELENLDRDISYKNEINKFLFLMKKKSENEVEDMFLDLENNLKWLNNNFEKGLGNLFRRPTGSVSDLLGLELDLKSKKFNIPMFESLLIAIDTIKKVNPSLANVSFNAQRFINLFNDSEFIDSISSQTNKYEKINYRIEKIKGVFDFDER